MTGLFAAVATPIDDQGRIDAATLDRLLAFLLDAGVDGVCVGGATGEYPHFERAERQAVIEQAAAMLGRDRALLVGIGSSSIRRVVELGRAALDAGSQALLLPMPSFFRYDQSDLVAYALDVVRTLGAPCLLYDLPDFSNGLAPETTLALLEGEPLIGGIKDSSGRKERLTRFAAARAGRGWTLMVGDDRLLLAGLQAGWSGGISGVAGFCPELLVALSRSARHGEDDRAALLHARLDELIGQMSVFPTPWAVRIGLAARGIATGPLPLPLTAERSRQIAAFGEWLVPWLERLPL